MQKFSQTTMIKSLIYLTLFLIPFYFFRFSIFGFKTNIFEVFVLISFIIFFYGHVSSLTIKKLHPIPIWVYLFLLASLIGVFLAQDKIQALGIFKGWFLFPVIFYFLITNNFNKKIISKLSIPLYLSLIIVSIWAVLQKFGSIGQLFYQVGDNSFAQYIYEGRAFGPFESPNYLAMYIVPMIFLSLPIFLSSSFSLRHKLKSGLEEEKSPSFSLRATLKRGLKGLLVLLYFLPLLALCYTTSRGGAVALAVSFIALILFLYFKSKVFRKIIEKQSNILIFGLLIVVTIFFIMAARKIAPNQGGDVIRLEIYNYSIEMINKNRLTGIGLGSFPEAIDRISANNHSFQEFGISYALHPHNVFLAMWLNIGITGLIIFLILLRQIIYNLFKNKTESFLKSCIFAALIAVLVHGLFDTTYFKNDLSAIFWLIFALAFLLSKSGSTSEKT